MSKNFVTIDGRIFEQEKDGSFGLVVAHCSSEQIASKFVRAVNSHANLLTALQAIYAMSQPHTKDNPFGLADSPESFRENVADFASAAIAKATS